MKIPKRRFPGIKPRHTGGVWKWRACFVAGGRQHVGQYREAQEEAHRDYEVLRAAQAGDAATITTLGQALGVLEQKLRLKGRDERYIVNNHKCRADYLLDFWESKSPLRQLGKKEVLWFINLALATRDEDGTPKKPRHPNTLIEKDLPLLHRCFEIAGLPSPVKQLTKEERPKRIDPEIDCFEIEEASALVERMRTGPLTVTIEPQHREYAADLVQFMLQSGIRPGELGRVTIPDVNWASREIGFLEKVGKQGFIAITPALEPVVRRLVARAQARGGPEGLLIQGGMNDIIQLLQRWQRYLQEPRLNARVLRHTSGTAVVEKLGLLAGRDHLRHAKATTTDKYMRKARKASVATSLDEFFKRSGDDQKGGPA